MDDKLARMIWLQTEIFTRPTHAKCVHYVLDERWQLACKIGELQSEISDGKINRDELVAKLTSALSHWINMILAVSGDATSREVADEIFTRFALRNSVIKNAAALQRLSDEEKKSE